MKRIIEKLKNESASAMVENVIILPLIFIIIFLMIMTCFMLHDRSTLEAAAKRGAIYASHCISDPNYANILKASGNDSGDLDISDGVDSFSFTGIGKNIQPYRYVPKSGAKDITSLVEKEVLEIVDNTRIPWRELDVDDVEYKNTNKFYYQDLNVSIDANYPLPKFFGAFGFDTEFTYTVTARMAVNDPDEFIRNADMVVDIIVKLDKEFLGGKIENAIDKISELGTKLGEWTNV